VARIYSTDHQEFDLNPETELESAIGELAYYSDEPSADAGALPLWFLSRMTRQQVTVALSGEGGDELFGGYLTYLADDAARWLRLVPSALRKQALAGLHRYWPVSDEKISFEYKLKRMIEGSLLPPDEAHWFWNGACSAAQKAELGVFANGRGLLPLVERLPHGSQEAGFLNRYLLLDQYYYLPDDILCKVDRMSMAHSLEVRPVLLDHRIVEFMARVPEHLKVHWGRKKVLLRELMRGKLPSSILNRKKAGLDVPAHDWFRGVLRPLLLDVLNREAVESTGIFRWEGVESLIRCHLERRANLGYQLWGLLTLFLWMKRWRIQAAPAESMGKVTSARILATN
jgi:asparagine synthase (glutamine-hydrolysing)